MDDPTAFEVDPSNLEQSEAWDGDEGDYWARHAAHFDRSVADYHRMLLEAAAVTATSTVLDIGCGTGQTTRDAARLAHEASALGVDLSSPMLHVARWRAEQEGVANVVFLHADAQTHPFEAGSFDVALSRSGVMFFGDPESAFNNIGAALKPSGRLVMAVWQGLAENEWFHAIGGCLAAGRELPAPPPGAPGPFALSDPDRVRGILASAGFDKPRFDGVREPMHFGSSVDEAHAFLVGLTGWMLEGLDESGRAGALDALRENLRVHLTADGIDYGSAMWLITATRS